MKLAEWLHGDSLLNAKFKIITNFFFVISIKIFQYFAKIKDDKYFSLVYRDKEDNSTLFFLKRKKKVFPSNKLCYLQQKWQDKHSWQLVIDKRNDKDLLL